MMRNPIDIPAPALSLSRREFMLSGSSVLAVAGFLGHGLARASIVDLGFKSKTVAGYAWPWTGRPGETIAFKVSTYAPGPYSVELVRLICADRITNGGTHYKEEKVEWPGAKSYPGRRQETFLGSFAQVDDIPSLKEGQSFSISLCLYPTLVPRGADLSKGSFAPGPSSGKTNPKLQHVISRWHEPSKTGWSLSLDEQGRPTFRVGGQSGPVRQVTLGKGLVLRRWVRLGVVYDAAAGTVRLTQDPVYRDGGDRSARSPERIEAQVGPLVQRGPLRFGAGVGGPSNTAVPAGAGVLNGKVDRARIALAALSDAELQEFHETRTPAAFNRPLAGWWDFAKGTGTSKIHDISGAGLDGFTVNLPVRATIGVGWDGRTLDWTKSPEQYSALHCHEDALSDAAWKTDFTYKIPSDLRSGCYAARLRHGDSEFCIPFYVAPPRASKKAKVALVIPTLTYLAYASAIGHSYITRKVLTQDANGKQIISEEEWMPIYQEEKSALDMAMRFGASYGYGVYRFYADGSPVYHAPMKIPNLANHPGAMLKHLTADTDLIEWLEHEKMGYDVITDELLHAEGAELLNGYATVMTGSHTEYLTWEMSDAYLAYLNQGGRLMSMGGNGFHNRLAFHGDTEGVVECRKRQGGTAEGNDYFFQAIGEFDGKPAGRFKEIGRPANVIQGVGTVSLHPTTAGTYYQRMPGADDPRAAFALAGIGRDEKIGNFGKAGGGAASEEIDMADLKDGTPPHALILATASDMVWPMVSEDGLTEPKYRINFNPHADIVFFETPNGGAVFSVGSMGWRASLSHNGFSNNVARISRNVLQRFTDPLPFVYPD